MRTEANTTVVAFIGQDRWWSRRNGLLGALTEQCPPGKWRRRLWVWSLAPIAASLLIIGQRALADGGVVRVRESAGPYLVTVFSSPAELLVGPADLSVLVQDRETDGVVLDGDVDLTFVPPPGMSLPIVDPFCRPGDRPATSVVRATRERATNKLLYAANVEFPAPGVWHMKIRVRHREQEATVTCTLPVIRNSALLARVWPSLALPPVMIALFVLHQRLPRRMSGETG